MTERNEACWCGSGKKYKKCHMAADEAKPRPKQKLTRFCKTPDEIIKMRAAGKFNGELIDYIRPHVKIGVSTGELNRLIHVYTLDHGHIPATLGYNGFPASCCTSIDNVVCHGIPKDSEILTDGHIVNVDCTTIVNGFFGDSSETFIMGTIPDTARHLVATAAQALIVGIKAVKAGVHLRTIGGTIEPFVKSRGCSVVHQYTGHGVGKKFHEYFSVYHHIDHECENIVLEPGMTLTIEPMINAGDWRVTTDKVDKWTVRTADGSLSAQFEHTVVVTEQGCEILTRTPSQIQKGVIIDVPGVTLIDNILL